MTDNNFPYLGEIDDWGNKSRPAIFIHSDNKYQVKIIFQESSPVKAHQELFGPHSITIRQNGYSISPAPFIVPKRLFFRSPSAPERAFILYPSGRYTIARKLGSESLTIILELDKFIQAPADCSYQQVDSFLRSLHSISFTSDFLGRWLKGEISVLKKDKEGWHFDIPIHPEDHMVEITQSQAPLTLNLRTQHSVMFNLLDITIGAPSNSIVTGNAGQSLQDLMKSELSIIRLLCLSFGCRIVIRLVNVSYAADDYRSFCFHSPQLAQFEQTDPTAERNLRKSRPLFYFSDIVNDAQNGIQKWFDLEEKANVGLLSLISDIIHGDSIPLENQIEDCCSTASYLKARVRDPNGKKHSIATTIFYLATDVLGLPEAKITDPSQSENNSVDAHQAFCWSNSIADYYNSLKHGDHKPSTQQGAITIQDTHTAAAFLIEFKLMLRFWIALQLGCTRKQLQDYLRNMNYQSPLGDYSLFTPWFKKHTNNNSDSADK